MPSPSSLSVSVGSSTHQSGPSITRLANIGASRSARRAISFNKKPRLGEVFRNCLKQFGVRSDSDEDNLVVATQFIDQKQITFNMQFSVISPVSFQLVVEPLF